MTRPKTHNGRRDSIAPLLPPDLAKFILDGIPYQYDANTEPVLVMGGPGFAADQLNAPKDGPAQDFGDNTKLPVGVSTAVDPGSPVSEAQIRANPWLSIWWYFGNQPHRVTKAVRIGYTVMQGGKQTTKHILIGYEGVDPQG